MITSTNLTKIYGDIRAVDDMSFQIADGECIGLLGLNGAGKTTLLRMMSCLLTPTSGRIIVDNADVNENPELVRPRIGYLPENPPLYEEMTVSKFLEFAAKLRQVPGGQVKSRVTEVAGQCQIDDVFHQQIETLSYGYKKRVGIAQAIVHRPPLVILDEPIAGLDPAQIVGMRDLIRKLRGAHTVVISSHILTEISQICDRILVVHRGRIVASGSEDQLSGELEQKVALLVKVTGARAELDLALKSFNGSLSYKVTGDENGVITAEVITASDQLAELSRALVHGGLGLLEFSRKQDRLESVFLSLTGKKGE
ncbi:MAG: ABC transporter ATP-binding protein [Proteobacteria bacterium]|nr:ABC transporter ATP-binding protein [Pseudomonadota bacterium]